MAKAATVKKPTAAPDDNAELFEDSTKASDKDLKDISKVVTEYLELEGELLALGEALKNTSEKLNKIKSDTLPALMAKAGTSGFIDAASGMEVKIADWMSCKWPKADPDNLKKALAWLKENKALDLIKCNISAAFGTKEAATARKFAKEIAKTGKATVELEESVHSQTLGKYIRECLAGRKKVPLEVFSVETGKWAEVKPVKGKKAKQVAE